MHSPTLVVMALFGLMWVAMVGVIVGNVAIASGAYIAEQGARGYDNGALWIYLLWVVGSLVMVSALAHTNIGRWLAQHVTPQRDSAAVATSLLWGTFVGLLFFIIYGALHGFPLLHATDRFDYWKQQGGMPRTLFGQMFLAALLMGALALLKYRSAVLLMVGIISIQILYGNKFSSLILVVFLFVLPSLLAGASRIRLGRSAIVVACLLAFIASAFWLVWSTVYAQQRQDQDLLSYLQERVALQGHLWWGTVDETALWTLDVDRLLRELTQGFGNEEDELTGMDGIMVQVGHFRGYERLTQGAQFTMAYPATIFAAAGIMGIIIAQIVYMGYYITLLALLKNALVRGELLLLLPLGKLLIDAIGFFGIGDVSLLLSFKTLAYWGALFALTLFYQRRQLTETKLSPLSPH